MDFGVTEARHHDDLIFARGQRQQQVVDLEGELRRLEQEHAEIVRPDMRLWFGSAILVIFAALGVALPLWVMGEGPQNLAPVRWVFYPFAGSLTALVGYIVWYLFQLTRKDRGDKHSS